VPSFITRSNASPAPGERWRSRYASDPAASRGRLIPEPHSPTRSPFQRDRDRVIHSGAFRRLQHKTQVFIYHEGDSFRTRLTHTIEVSQIARALSRSLGLDEDLAEALALSHDLGHTPFGHTGEDALEVCLAEVGGFDHNAQALRIVTRLEHRYAAFDGLNLSWETLEGLVKHNGPLLGPDGLPTRRYRERGVPLAILDYDRAHPLELDTQAGPEAQAAALADDIAYNAHDIDDGLRAGILAIEDFRSVPFLDGLLREIDALHPGLEPTRRIHELTRRVITRHVEDVLVESGRRLEAADADSAASLRALPQAVIAFSPALAEADAAIKAHLFPMLYRHPRLMAVRRDAEAIVRDLFGRFMGEPAQLPETWQADLAGADEPKLARRVGDYIAGMTDRYAVLEHQRLFPTTPDLRLT
jgi:dGTPase